MAVDDDHQAEALVRSLQADGYRVVALVEQAETGRIATVRLGVGDASDEGVVLDLLFASSGVEAEVVEGAEDMELFEGLSAPIASLAALIALKCSRAMTYSGPRIGSTSWPSSMPRRRRT